MGQKRNLKAEWWDPQHKWHTQRHPTIYELNLLILMTINDMKCSSNISIQIKSEVGKLQVVCYKLAGNSLRQANFTEPSVVPNVIGMIVSCFETECSNTCAYRSTVNCQLDIMSLLRQMPKKALTSTMCQMARQVGFRLNHVHREESTIKARCWEA